MGFPAFRSAASRQNGAMTHGTCAASQTAPVSSSAKPLADCLWPWTVPFCCLAVQFSQAEEVIVWLHLTTVWQFNKFFNGFDLKHPATWQHGNVRRREKGLKCLWKSCETIVVSVVTPFTTLHRLHQLPGLFPGLPPGLPCRCPRPLPGNFTRENSESNGIHLNQSSNVESTLNGEGNQMALWASTS